MYCAVSFCFEFSGIQQFQAEPASVKNNAKSMVIAIFLHMLAIAKKFPQMNNLHTLPIFVKGSGSCFTKFCLARQAFLHYLAIVYSQASFKSYYTWAWYYYLEVMILD